MILGMTSSNPTHLWLRRFRGVAVSDITFLSLGSRAPGIPAQAPGRLKNSAVLHDPTACAG